MTGQEPVKVLFVENNEADAKMYRRYLNESEDEEYEVEVVDRLDGAIDRITEANFDIVLLDLGLPDSRGLQTVEGVQEVYPDGPIVILTDLDYEEIARQTLEMGVQDYLVKNDLSQPLLTHAIRYALQRSKTQAALKRSERTFRQLAENIQEVFWLVDTGRGEFEYISPAFEDTWDRSPELLLEDPQEFYETLHPDDVEEVRESHPLSTGQPEDLEYRIETPDGEVRWIRDRSFHINEAKESVTRVAGLVQDVTDLKVREQNLEETLSHRDQMLSGVHHRVKNNLELINRLITLKSQGSETEEVQQTLDTLSNRIDSMLLIHDQLNTSARNKRVDLYEFTESLVSELQSLRDLPFSVLTRLEIEPVNLNVEDALSLGLVLLELITIAYEHAEQEDGQQIEIQLRQPEEGNFELEVKGVVTDEPEGPNLGMRFVRKIVRDQLSGELEKDPEDKVVGIVFSLDQTSRSESTSRRVAES